LKFFLLELFLHDVLKDGDSSGVTEELDELNIVGGKSGDSNGLFQNFSEPLEAGLDDLLEFLLFETADQVLFVQKEVDINRSFLIS